MKTAPEGTSALDIAMGNYTPVELNDNTPADNPPPSGNNPPSADNPPSVPAVPASADNPPPAPPASGDNPPPVPPAPAFTPPTVINEQDAIRALFGDKYKSKAEIEAIVGIGERGVAEITPYRTVLEKLATETTDPEIVALENFKKVTGSANPQIKGFVETAWNPNASELDVLVADILLKMPGRASRLEETKQELINQYNIAEGQPLSLLAEQEVQAARQRLSEIQGKVSAMPVSKIDIEQQVQAAKEGFENSKNQWMSVLENGIDNFSQSSPEVQLFEGFKMKIDASRMKQLVPQLSEMAALRGTQVTNETALEVLAPAFKSMIADNLQDICESYYNKRKMEEDQASDKPLPVGRNPDVPPAQPKTGYDQVKEYLGI